MVTLAILLLSLQFPTARITLETRAARASVVLKHLSTVAKVDLQASPAMEGEILLISVKDQPIGDVMTRIATATSGTWKHEGAVYRLVADETARRKEARLEMAERADRIRADLKFRVESEKKQQAILEAKRAKAKDKTLSKEELAEAQADLTATEASDDAASSAMMTSLLQGLDPDELAQIGAGDRVVYATNPTRMQRSLGNGAAEAVSQFVQIHDDKVERFPRAFLPVVANQAEDGMPRQIKPQGAKLGSVAKALLVVEQNMYESGQALRAELRLYDSKGNVVHTDDASVGVPAVDRGQSEGDEPRGPQAGAGTPVRYSPDSKAFIAMLKELSKPSFAPYTKIAEDLRKKLYAPDRYDPLSYMQTDEVLSFAGGKLPLVADVPDDWNGGLMSGRNVGNETTESVAKKISDKEGLRAVPDPAFLVLKPSHAEASRSIRANRPALARLLKTTLEREIPSVEDLAEFALQSKDPMPNGVDLTYIAMLVPGALFETVSGTLQWDTLRFYGSLSPESRRALAAGERLPMGTMTSGQRASLERLIYGVDTKLVSDQSKEVDEEEFLFSFTTGADVSTSFADEPTEVAPNGLPNNGYFEVRTTVEKFAVPFSEDSGQAIGVLSVLEPAELAMFKLVKQTDSSSDVPSFAKVRMGSSTRIGFTFHVGPHSVMRSTLHDRRIAKDSPIVAMDGLPADFQQSIDAAYDRLKKNGPTGNSASGTIHP